MQNLTKPLFSVKKVILVWKKEFSVWKKVFSVWKKYNYFHTENYLVWKKVIWVWKRVKLVCFWGNEDWNKSECGKKWKVCFWGSAKSKSLVLCAGVLPQSLVTPLIFWEWYHLEFLSFFLIIAPWCMHNYNIVLFHNLYFLKNFWKFLF